jgi:sarcosine oxidase/L-pipecolate oxidase
MSAPFPRQKKKECKVMEKIIRDVLIHYMEVNGFFTKHQHGFRKGHSCATQLIEVMEQWTEDLDKKNSIDVIYLDFQKAFDTVPYKRLIHKLKGYGISGNLLLWIEDFLHERKQRVVSNGQSSSWTEVTSGIPQESVLGTILFTIYINDLPDALENMIKLFADDTKVFATVNNEEDKNSLQGDIDKLMNWSDTW